MRRPSGHSKIEGVSSALQQKTQGLKKGFVVKPIIEPEEHIVSYEPIVYEMVEEIIYEDPSMIATKEMAIGNDQSFSMLDPNMSVDYGRYCFPYPEIRIFRAGRSRPRPIPSQAEGLATTPTPTATTTSMRATARTKRTPTIL
jgi:hypothetical protein